MAARQGASLGDVFEALRTWEQPRLSANPLKLGCRLEAGASASEVADAWPASMPADEIVALWSCSRESWLFEDVEYGQWGLHLLSPAASAARTAAERSRRPEHLRESDVVVGEFLGDSELLVHSPSETGSRRFLVALPLDPRDDWWAAGGSVVAMLDTYLANEGEKFWERAGP